MANRLRGAWRDHCFPEPFSWFLHETGLESLKISSAGCFYWNVEGKTRKKQKNTASFVASLGAGVQPRSTVQLFMPVSGVEKKRRFGSIFLAPGCHLARKSLSWTAMPVSNKKQEFEQRKRIKLFDDFWVRTYQWGFCELRHCPWFPWIWGRADRLGGTPKTERCVLPRKYGWKRRNRVEFRLWTELGRVFLFSRWWSRTCCVWV